MNKIRRSVELCLMTLLVFSTLKAEDYRLIITYPNASNEWGRRLASGENKTVMKIQFIDLDEDNDYKLHQLAVRPFTDQDEWYIDSLQLWKNIDNYPGSLDRNSDSLINTINIVGLDATATSMTMMPFSLVGELNLNDTATFFVTMVASDWFTDDVDDREITDQNGAQLGITVEQPDDIGILRTDDNVGSANNWAGDVTKVFTVQAVNLPVYIYNRNRTAEEDSNMFYSNYLELDDSDGSRAQIITDLTIEAHVFLPHNGNLSGDSLSYASFKVGWNNQYLALDSIAFGDLWDNKQYQDNGWEESGYGESTLPGDTTLSVVRFEAVVIGNSLSPENYVNIANNSLGIFYFKVLKPGISPLLLSDVLILDQWGIPYHCYRNLQNDADDTAEKYDAWSKQILGDFAGSAGTLIDGECDGLIDPVYDITLFADYIWMNADSADWYTRFDVGDSASHDPDELSPDDTTNFFDLMVIGTNYYRTLQGDFSQKAVAFTDTPELVFNVAGDVSKPDIYQAKLDMRNIPEFVSAQLKLTFDPLNYRLKELTLGDWVIGSSSQNVLLYSPDELKKGIVDVNFLALKKPISGEGCFLTVDFEKIGPKTDLICLDYVDLRNRNCQQVALGIKIQPEPAMISDYFLMECYPNPFNPVTNLRYSVPDGSAGNYWISVYDLQGKLVRELSNNYHSAGQYRLVWNGLNHLNVPVGSGIYFIRVEGAELLKNYKITLMR
ncbi:T9SS type A sorting domain-containing protein [bacterium]|nr:T9SS type A sorting domain-containing protein [bacterium]MBU1063597.1 T9SS type A sorting domain-containing protein [bacterium]MBU1635695.1 T9SS type A sorting domain-containing protein [bacterium]MBU1874538.1 T9SS type A sorting domain-containing protein [bacterium]